MLRNQNNKKKCLCSGYCLVLIASKQLLLVEFYIFWNLSLCCDLPRNLFTSGKMPMKTLGVNVCSKASYLSIYHFWWILAITICWFLCTKRKATCLQILLCALLRYISHTMRGQYIPEVGSDSPLAIRITLRMTMANNNTSDNQDISNTKTKQNCTNHDALQSQKVQSYSCEATARLYPESFSKAIGRSLTRSHGMLPNLIIFGASWLTKPQG